MNLSELVRDGRLKPGKFTPKQVEDRLALARRDIRSAEDEDDSDWALAKAYNAMLSAAQAVLMHHGYRPAEERGHVATIQGARVLLGEKFQDTLDLMDRMRRKRHIALYDTPASVSSMEAFEARVAAKRFVEAISKLLEA